MIASPPSRGRPEDCERRGECRPKGRYKYLDVLTTTFVVILLLSNLVAQKICMIGRWPSVVRSCCSL